MIEDNLNIDYEMIKNKRIELNMSQDKLSELGIFHEVRFKGWKREHQILKLVQFVRFV